MRQIMSGLLALALLVAIVPLAAQAGSDTVAYKPGVLKAAIEKGETVFVDYKASW